MIGERSTASGQAALIFFNYASQEAQTIEQALGTANASLIHLRILPGMRLKKDAQDTLQIMRVE